MELNLDVLPQHDEGVRMDAGLASPMGGKHQRSRSLSAKWANDKALALEYLHRQHEVITWTEHVLQRKLPTTDLFEALKSGIVLRELVEALFPDASNCMSPISRNYTKRMAPWKERENISVFLRQCKALGMNNLSLFCTDDLYEGNDMLQVLFCAQHFKLFAEDRSNEVFHPVTKNQPAVFSNQDLEMALSKIEKSGVDSTALQGLMSGSGSSSCPEQCENKATSAEAVKSPKSKASICSPISEEAEEEHEEPAETDCSVEQQLETELQNNGVCNQKLEEKADVAVTEVKAESSSEQESEADIEGSNEVAECEDASDMNTSSEDCVLEDKATKVVIAHVLADMAAAIEEADIAAYQKALAAAQMMPRQAECHVMETEIPSTESCADVEPEIKTAIMDTGKSDTMVLELVDHKATQMPSDVNLNHYTKTSTKSAKSAKAKKQASSEEELEAETMAKCTCGKGCSIM